MKSIFIVSFAIVLMGILVPYVLSSESEATKNNYEFYLLAVEWTGSVCRSKSCRYRKENDNQERFNLHGLWPQKNVKTHGPMSCRDEGLNYDSISSELREELELYWNGLYHPTEQFLEHEWSKHGTCWSPDMANRVHKTHSVVARLLAERSKKSRQKHHQHLEGEILENEVKPLPEYQGEKKVFDSYGNEIQSEEDNSKENYFRRVLTIAKYYDVYQMLAQGGVVPSSERTYTGPQIREALGRSLGVTDVIFTCENVKNIKYLKEVRICLGLDYKPMNCPDTVLGENNCGNNSHINYPEAPY